jgi:hypothetical protein
MSDWFDDGYSDARQHKYLPPFWLEVGIRAGWRYRIGWLYGKLCA